MTALMVCMRFSASSNTLDCVDSNTATSTSISVTPNCSAISAPLVVLVWWNDGSQCMKMASGEAMAMTSFVTR